MPTVAETLALGYAFLRSGQLEEAVLHIRQALKNRPDIADAHKNLGDALFVLGKPQEAVIHYREALSLDPDYADPHCNLGHVLRLQGNIEQAIHHCRQALRIRPDFAEAHNNLGVALQSLGRVEEAATHFREALRIRPSFADAHNSLGHALLDQGKPEEAVDCFRLALRHNPNFAGAHNNLGLAFERLGKLDQAVHCYRQAKSLDPNLAEVSNNLGSALAAQAKWAEAVGCFQEATRLRSDFADAYYNLANCLAQLKELDDAIRYYRQTLQLKPDLAKAHFNLGSVLVDQGQLALALACFRQALQLQPNMAGAWSSILFCLNYDTKAEPDAVFAEYRRWGGLVEAKAAPLPHVDNPDPDRKLRIGYVSPDFRNHALARYFEPVLAHHDPRQVEVFCYAEVARPDAATERMRKLAHVWRWTCGLSDAQVAQRVQDDGIDILVDLAGHSASNRLGVFALKPAPVQATWLGFMNTTGLSRVDYRLTDEVLDPPGQLVRDTEELLRLPGGMCCLAFPGDSPAITPLPARRNGHLTFGSLHGLFKLNADGFDVWSEILAALPGARLLLCRDTLAGSPTERIRREFADRGIAGDRLTLRSTPHALGHLGHYQDIDVSLDAFPCTGGVTTCESLWMGVPVLTLCGARPMGRNSAAILSRVGLTDWVVQTPQEYVARAVRLANELDQLAEMRLVLRDRVATTLCDASRLTRALEDAYRTIWRRWCAKQA